MGYNVFMRDQNVKSDFGNRLKEARRSKGLTQYELADLSGISQRMIVHYETVVKMPPVEKVKRIAEALGISSDELLGMPTPTKEQKKREDVSYRIMKRVNQIESLPKRDQDMVFRFINSLLEKNKIEKD